MTEERFRFQIPSWALIFIFLCLNHGIVSDSTYWINPPDSAQLQNVTVVTWVVGDIQTLSWYTTSSNANSYTTLGDLLLVQQPGAAVNGIYEIHFCNSSISGMNYTLLFLFMLQGIGHYVYRSTLTRTNKYDGRSC